MELSESGEMVKGAIYHPFGREIVSVSASAVLPPLGSGGVSGTHGSRYSFAGKEKDRESDVHYFEWRYYDDGSGRFTSVDPVYYEVGITERGKEALLDPEMMHPYVYGRNGPMRYVDPTGQVAESPWDAANVTYDIGGICGGIVLYCQGVIEGNPTYKQYGLEGIKNSSIDLVADSTALLIPGLPAGGSKIARALSESGGNVDVAGDFLKSIQKGNYTVTSGGKEAIIKNTTKSPTANDLISGGVKKSKSYHSPYGSKTVQDLEKMSKAGDNKAGKMLKLIKQNTRLEDKGNKK